MDEVKGLISIYLQSLLPLNDRQQMWSNSLDAIQACHKSLSKYPPLHCHVLRLFLVLPETEKGYILSNAIYLNGWLGFTLISNVYCKWLWGKGHRVASLIENDYWVITYSQLEYISFSHRNDSLGKQGIKSLETSQGKP